MGIYKAPVLFAFLFILPAAGISATLQVPSEYSTIQSAINVAEDGDIILVGPDSENGGPYVENINFLGKAVTVMSSEGPYLTTIDGNRKGSVVKFWGNEGRDSVLMGFTITNGTGEAHVWRRYGGGISCWESSPTILNNIITKNVAIHVDTKQGCGGGIGAASGSPEIRNNIITRNETQYGGGISLDSPASSFDPIVLNNIIMGNKANFGGGICMSYQPLFSIVSNTIVENSAEEGGGLLLSYSDVSVSNTILWGNTAHKGPEGYLGSFFHPSSLSISYSDVQGGTGSFYLESNCTLDWGPGMIDADPLFVNALNGDFHLRLASPCLDAGSSEALFHEDYEGDNRIVDGNQDGSEVADMGADELLPEIAARFGTVNRGGNFLVNVLLVNGEPGNSKRIQTVRSGKTVTVSMNVPPSGPDSAEFALYGIRYEPGPADMALQPEGIGLSCMPMPLSKKSTAPPPYTIVNNLEPYSVLGYPYLPDVPPAPCTFISETMPPGTYTFQGYILDYGTASSTGFSLTNAVVIKVL